MAHSDGPKLQPVRSRPRPRALVAADKIIDLAAWRRTRTGSVTTDRQACGHRHDRPQRRKRPCDPGVLLQSYSCLPSWPEDDGPDDVA
jgi:hypothetical protein